MSNYFTQKDIDEMDFVKRLNLINSITGVKPANLIGTKSQDGKENLAIVSSVVHLGSNPAMVGFVMRPTTDVPRHTYSNILETKLYTINSVGSSFTDKAHYTSAKFEEGESEFDKCKLESEHLKGFDAPFVANSSIKIGMELCEVLPIKKNGTVFVVGEVKLIKVAEVEKNGMLDLEKLGVSGISGLNSYYQLKKLGTYPYARVNEVPDFK